MSGVVFVTVEDISKISGSGVATREIIRGIGEVTDEPLYVLCPSPEDGLDERIEENVEEFLFLPPETDSGSPGWHLKMEFSVLRNLWTLLRNENISVVVTRLSPSTLFPAPLCRLFGVPHVALIRGWVRRRGAGGTKFGQFVEQVVRMNVRLSSRVYVAFEELKEWVDPHRADSQSPVEVLPNAVDPDRFVPMPIDEAREEIGLETDGFVVGFVGSLAPRHEVSTLIEAVAGINDVELLIVGDGERRDELEQLAGDLDIRDRVTFAGRVPHEVVPTYIAAFDVGYGVVSPDKASNPIKCYEYLSCERPVLTSQKGEFEFVSDIDAGETVESVSTAEVRTAIEAVQGRSRSDLFAAGRNGRNYVCKHHTWQVVADRVLEPSRT